MASANGICLRKEPGFSMGPHTFRVPVRLFKENRERLCCSLRKTGAPKDSVVFLQGAEEIPWHCTDVTYPFKQESYFQWICGGQEPGLYVAVRVSDGYTTLMIPRLPDEYAIWMGKLRSPEDFKIKYDVNNVRYTDEIAETLREMGTSELLTLMGKNTDSGLTCKPASFDGIDQFVVNKDSLHPVIAECRVFKSPLELDVLRYVAAISSDAHIQVMRSIRPGMMEYQCEAVFLQHIYAVGGCRQISYTCICCAGENGAILHYGHAGAPNDSGIKDGAMCLFDMGGNYYGYAADITCSFPANGKFTDDQRMIYNAVLKANQAVMTTIKPGVPWVDMHILANKVMLEALKNGGVLQGNVDDMIEAGLGAVFQPHGLGHFLGLDVHDVHGYPEGGIPRPTKPGLSKLRTARVLQKDMVITIEPGCYFIHHLLDAALADQEQSKFLVPSAICRLRNFGGVRIEDDVIITEDGCENMTKVPRTVEEIEAAMSEKCDWEPKIKTSHGVTGSSYNWEHLAVY